MIVLKNSYINLTTVLHNNDINMDEILSQLSEELPSDFNPNDYAVEWEITVSSPTDNWEMPKYTIEDLKIDIEPMLFDLNSDEINELLISEPLVSEYCFLNKRNHSVSTTKG